MKRWSARLLTGARLSFAVAIALGLMARAAAARSLLPDEGPGPLPWRVGGESGFGVDAASFPDSSGVMLEVYVRIRPATLESLAQDREEPNHFQLSIRLRNAFGASEHDVGQEFTVSPGDTAGGYGKVILFPLRTRPGVHRLRVSMTTRRRALKRGQQGKPHTESVEGEVTVPGPQGGRELSDLEFVWSESASPGTSGFQRGGRIIIPNPERLYGLYADSLRAVFLASALGQAPRPWRWVARVLNADGQVVVGDEGSAAPARTLEVPIALDLAKQAAGGYDLEVKAWQEGDSAALLRRAHFSVAWQADSWLESPQDVLDQAHLLLQPADEEAFARLHPGEQERVLDAFWRKRDPSPETAENEVRDTFLKRVDFANRSFGRFGLGRGMFSDMGRVFIRYGEPSEVLKQVIPSLDHTLAETIHDLVAQDDREVGDVHNKTMGADMRPFEVWIYEGEIPLPPEVDPSLPRAPRARRRLVFLFVDEQWLGDFRLRYSTE
jgi:GWxTD domain-containing protein